MGHEVRYVFYDIKKKIDYDFLMNVLFDNFDIEYESFFYYGDGGHIKCKARHPYSFDIKEFLKEKKVTGKFKIDVYYLERNPDEELIYEGEEK